MSNGLLAGLMWGMASGKSKASQDILESKVQTAEIVNIYAKGQIGALENALQSHQRENYVQTTKLNARLETERELLEQLAEENITQVPLANLESFEEKYLLNLIKARKDQATIEEVYGDAGIPISLAIKLNERKDEIVSELQLKGYDIP